MYSVLAALYYSTSAVKVGFLAGIESYSMILALNTDTALAKSRVATGSGRSKGCLGGDRHDGRGRFTGYHESEAGRCGVHLWRERADGDCPSRAQFESETSSDILS